MSDFKGSIWLSAEDVGSGHDLVLDDRNCECEEGIIATQQYIRADLVPKWQPIETAPADDEPVLLTNAKARDVNGNRIPGTRVGSRSSLTGNVVGALGEFRNKDFTHWMPIPKVPE